VLVFVLLLVCEFLYGWAWNTVDVLRPYIRESLGLSLIEAGSAYSAQGAGALIGAIVLGQIADRIGRRRVLSGLVFGYGVLLLAGMMGSYPQLLLQRFLLGSLPGLVSGSCRHLHQPVPADLARRLAGTLNAAFSLSIVVLGVAMGLVAPGNWKHLLLIGGIPPLALALLVLAAIPTGSRMDRQARRGIAPAGQRTVRARPAPADADAGDHGRPQFLRLRGVQRLADHLPDRRTRVQRPDRRRAGRLAVQRQYRGRLLLGLGRRSLRAPLQRHWLPHRFGRDRGLSAGPADPTVLKLAGLIYGARCAPA
jgi:MFS family permease